MRHNWKTAAAGIAALLLAATASAGDGAKHQAPEFSDFDLDGDGHITSDEFIEGHAERFRKMADEGRELKYANKLPGMFEKIDTDGDQQISPEEFDEHRAQKPHKMQHGKKKHGKKKHGEEAT